MTREDPTLGAFLAYLKAAESEEFGLEAGRVGETNSVKLLTVHAAKGLEWDVVAIPGLVWNPTKDGAPGDRVRGKIILSVIFGVLVIAGLGLFTDLGHLGQSLSTFNWALIPAILGLTLFNYVLRFFKWDYYVHLVSERRVSKSIAHWSSIAASLW